jgi:ABC-type transport system involved in multi-copper enzyme maturation permease subunit
VTGIPTMAALQVEVRAILSRRSGQAAVAVAVAVGILGFMAMATAQNMAGSGAVTLQGADLGDMVTVSGPDAAGWALRARNFFVLPMFMLLATGGTIAAELVDHTMRERLVRAVPRWQVLLTKVAALMVLSALTLVATFIPAIAGGVVRFGIDGPWIDVLLGYGATWFADLGIVTMGALLSTFFRGSGGVVVGGIMVLLGDLVLRNLLTFLAFVGLSQPAELIPYLPGSALGCWQGMSSGWTVQPFIALVVFIALCFGLALARFRRMVIP